VAKGISANMQVAHGKIAQMMKFMIPQYMTTRDTLAILGPDGVSTKVFDYEPEKLTPAHMPYEKPEGESSVSDVERAKWFAKNLKVISVPNSLMNVTAMQEKMIYMNALQRGWPVSFSTAFAKIGIEWPTTPGADELEKYKHEQFEMLEMKAKAAQVAQAEMGGQQQQEHPGQGKGGGRPPSGKEPPKLETRGNKSGNLRTVVSQSK
jgi:hypothetical protein